jgi:methylase of polypeptide subunit release factors
LRPGGLLLFEFGFGQEIDAEQLLRDSRALAFVDLKRDLQGIARTAIARRI